MNKKYLKELQKSFREANKPIHIRNNADVLLHGPIGSTNQSKNLFSKRFQKTIHCTQNKQSLWGFDK
jgi:hypothetical protein